MGEGAEAGEGKEKADGVTFEINSLEEMCDLMCDNNVDGVSDSFPKSIELKKRSLHERIIVAKVLLESVLDELPSAQPRKGKWIKGDCNVSEYRYFCSRCKAHHRAMYDYCPSCGASMKEGEQDG